MNYYNEFDPFAAAWLRGLIKAGLIAPGVVDSRSIADVKPDELKHFTQCHFFAGIGGWSYALRLAGWADDRPVWTGSCPCQPFSAAGKRKGVEDERHLWPVFFNLIKECRPDVCFGEQVASAIGHGWLCGIQADLEREDYAVGSVVLGAHSVGAPHQRQRLYWVAGRCVGNSDGTQADSAESGQQVPGEGCACGGMADSMSAGRTERRPFAGDRQASGCSEHGRLVHSIGSGLERHAWDERDGHEPGRLDANEAGSAAATSWSDCIWHPCRDGKARRVPVEPAFFPLADGISPARVGILRGAGNAIVPQVATAFIEAWMVA